jgi:hypothetical protein
MNLLIKHLLPGLTAMLFALPMSAQKTFHFTYNGTVYTYYGSYVNDPSSQYTTYVNAHPGSGLFAAQPADGHYNCHAFAWANDNTVWVQTYGASTDAPQLFYNTGYYVQTTEADAEIAVYGNIANPIHSAVRITSSSNPAGAQALSAYPRYAGWWISKWDGGPVVVHRIDDCPYWLTGLSATYYKKSSTPAGGNHISGSGYAVTGGKVVCVGGTQFTLNCGTPASFTVTWSGSSNITFPSGAQYPLTAVANGHGAGYIQATLHFIDGTTATTAQYPVWVGIPDYITSISTSQWTAGPGTSHTITVPQSNATFYAWPFDNGGLVPPNPIDAHGVSSYTWTCTSAGGAAPTFYQNPAVVGYRYTNGGFSPANLYATMNVEASNGCGSVRYPQAIYVSSSGFFRAMSPNPAGNQVTITLSDENSLAAPQSTTAMKAAPATYTVRIIGLTGTVYATYRKTGNNFTIPVNNLKSGNYTVEISDGKTVSSKPLVVAH